MGESNELTGEYSADGYIVNQSSSNTYGFVIFKYKQDAQKACQGMHNRWLDGGRIIVSMAKGPKTVVTHEANPQNDTQLYVGSLPHSVRSDADLVDVFQDHGFDVSEARVMRFPDGTPKGFGFIHFSSPSEQQRAFEARATIRGPAGEGLLIDKAKKHPAHPEVVAAHDLTVVMLQEEEEEENNAHRRKRGGQHMCDDEERSWDERREGEASLGTRTPPPPSKRIKTNRIDTDTHDQTTPAAPSAIPDKDREILELCMKDTSQLDEESQLIIRHIKQKYLLNLAKQMDPPDV